MQRTPAPSSPAPSSSALSASASAASRPSGLLRPSASPYRKVRDEGAKVKSLSKPQVKGNGTGSRLIRTTSLERPRREPATVMMDAKAEARGVGGDAGRRVASSGKASSTPAGREGANVRPHRRSCAGPLGGSEGGASAGIWRWSGSQTRLRTPLPAGKDGECPRETKTATLSATGLRAPRSAASPGGPTVATPQVNQRRSTLAAKGDAGFAATSRESVSQPRNHEEDASSIGSILERNACVPVGTAAKQALGKTLALKGAQYVDGAPLALSTAQETAVQKVKTVAFAAERPPSPGVLSRETNKVGFREGDRPPLAKSTSSPCKLERERKTDRPESASLLPRRRSGPFVKKQFLAATISTTEAAMPEHRSSTRSTEASADSMTRDQEIPTAAMPNGAARGQRGILPETRSNVSSAAMSDAVAQDSSAKKGTAMPRHISSPFGAMTPPGARFCLGSRSPPLHTGSAESLRPHDPDIAKSSDISFSACDSPGELQPSDSRRCDEDENEKISHDDSVSMRKADGPYLDNDAEPDLALAALPPAPKPLGNGNCPSFTGLLLVVGKRDDSARETRDSGSAFSSNLREANAAQIGAGRDPLSPSFPSPSLSSSSKSFADQALLEGQGCGQMQIQQQSLNEKQKQQEEENNSEKLKGYIASDFELGKLCASAVVQERRKNKAGFGSVVSPGGGKEKAHGWRRGSCSDGFTFESSSEDESSGSDKEGFRDGDVERGDDDHPASEEKSTGWASFVGSFVHPYSAGSHITDTDFVRHGSCSSSGSSSSSSSSSSAGSARTSSASSSGGEVEDKIRPSWTSPTASAPSLTVEAACCGSKRMAKTAEIGVQTEAGPSVAHALLQVGEGRLLSKEVLREKATLEELRERLRMMSCDLEAEVFHREVVKQEQEQLRRRLVAGHEEDIERLRRAIKEKEVDHNNEKIRMRWEHAEELEAERAELEDGGAAKDKLQEIQDMLERERDYHTRELDAERERVREARIKLAEAERVNREAARRQKTMEDMMRQLIEENEELRGFGEEFEAGDGEIGGVDEEGKENWAEGDEEGEK